MRVPSRRGIERTAGRPQSACCAANPRAGCSGAHLTVPGAHRATDRLGQRPRPWFLPHRWLGSAGRPALPEIFGWPDRCRRCSSCLVNPGACHRLVRFYQQRGRSRAPSRCWRCGWAGVVTQRPISATPMMTPPYAELAYCDSRRCASCSQPPRYWRATDQCTATC